MRGACVNCEGIGKALLMNTWFVADGYRHETCGICGGTGINPSGYQIWPGHAAFLETAHERIAEWGGLKPRASISKAAA